MPDATIATVAMEAELAAVEDLKLGYTPRITVDKRHLLRLAETVDAWSPLVVRRGTMQVIDGVHRLAAARQLQLSHVTVSYFDGDDDAAMLEALRLNLGHGLPLTLRERK